MKLTDNGRAVLVMWGLAFILSFWGLNKYAGAGLLGAGIYDGIKLYLKSKKVKTAQEIK